MRAYVSSQSECISQNSEEESYREFTRTFGFINEFTFKLTSSSRQKEMDRFGVIRASSRSDGFTIQIYALGERERCVPIIYFILRSSPVALRFTWPNETEIISFVQVAISEPMC